MPGCIPLTQSIQILILLVILDQLPHSSEKRVLLLSEYYLGRKQFIDDNIELIFKVQDVAMLDLYLQLQVYIQENFT